ncbi:MAG: hypothetical protein COB13_007730 [OCS116 cluster bacterium]|nr:hypothetical protein [OCS116 cluster bacterium]
MDAKQKIELPRHVSIDFYDDYMHIKKRWRGISTIFLTIFSLIWLYGVTLFTIDIFSHEPEAMNMLIGLFLAVMSWFIFYSTLSNWVNSTDVFVSKNVVEIKFGPVFWPGNKRFELDDVKQFYVKTRITSSAKSRQVSYQLRFIEKNDNDMVLIEGSAIKEYLLFVEQEIEKHLGIKDVKISEE